MAGLNMTIDAPSMFDGTVETTVSSAVHIASLVLLFVAAMLVHAAVLLCLIYATHAVTAEAGARKLEWTEDGGVAFTVALLLLGVAMLYMSALFSNSRPYWIAIIHSILAIWTVIACLAGVLALLGFITWLIACLGQKMDRAGQAEFVALAREPEHVRDEAGAIHHERFAGDRV